MITVLRNNRRRIYNKRSVLDFGMFKGYQLGVVYLFDPAYIDWCINNVDDFYIPDLDELKEIGVYNKSIDWQYKLIGDPSLIPNIDVFTTFDEYIENVAPGQNKYPFSDETIKLNYSRASLYGDYDRMENNIENDEDEWDYDYNDYDSYRSHDSGQCPACGARGEYNCCNYWLESNT